MARSDRKQSAKSNHSNKGKRNHKFQYSSKKKINNDEGSFELKTSKRKGRKLEIKFDPEKRREYLTGFSARKKERRAYGLAMQKVKDRKTKLEIRKENREAKEAQIHELEQQKRRLAAGMVGEINSSDEESENAISFVDAKDSDNITQVEDDKRIIDSKEKSSVVISKDVQFGDDVIVTTSFGLPDDSDDEADKAMLIRRQAESKKGIDIEQKVSGSIKHMMEEVRKSGVLTNKVKSSFRGNVQKKGKHGASDMKGIGGASNLKAAKKTLSMVLAKKGSKNGAGGRSARGKRR